MSNNNPRKQMTLVKLFFYTCVLLVSLSCTKKTTKVHVLDSVTPSILYSTDADRPLKVLAEAQWGREIEGGEYGSRGATPDTPLGIKTVSLPIFMSQVSKDPVTIHLQYSGLRNKTEGYHNGADLPTIVEVHCPDTTEACGQHLGTQSLMGLGSDKPSPYDWTEVHRNGQVKYVLVGESDIKLQIPNKMRTKIYLLFLVPKDVETQYMKATVFYGDYAKTPPESKPFYESNIFVILIKFAWLLVPILFMVLHRAHEGVTEDTPKILGGFFIFSGTLTCLAFPSFQQCGIGLLVAFAGVFLVFGHAIAKTIYLVVVIFIWGAAITIFVKDDSYRNLLQHVFMPTLFVLYLYSNRVSQQLAY